MTLTELEQRLASGLAGPLPGPSAQARLAPRPRPGWKAGFVPERSRHAAALLLLFPLDDEPHLLLTVRAGDLPHHGGQVALPGGAIEKGETIVDAALREAHEEVGLEPHEVLVLGELTPLFIPVSGYLLHPVVALMERKPALARADLEVARILHVPVAHLLDPARLRTLRRERDGVEYDVPCYEVCGEQVWGATAMVLAEFVDLVSNEQ
jgi:8-oxo-dGTP pyrophosphatase MutT (NUDIX family)